MEKDRKDFKNWIRLMHGEVQINKLDWKEIQFQLNTGKCPSAKQDLTALFWNSYVYFEQKFKVYFDEFNLIPTEVFNELIFEFRQSFPKSGRIEGVNYFDDLIEMLIEKYLSQVDEDIENSNPFINNFDTIDSNIVYQFFKINLVGKKHLTEQELDEYLIQAFTKRSKPKNRFQLKNVITKRKINAIFYNYYTDVAGSPHGKRKDYASLLGEYFEGYSSENVSTNFNK